MDRIKLFRSAGLSLQSIAVLLEKEGSELDITLEGHQDFLESIGIEEDEVAEIRQWSKIS